MKQANRLAPSERSEKAAQNGVANTESPASDYSYGDFSMQQTMGNQAMQRIFASNPGAQNLRNTAIVSRRASTPGEAAAILQPALRETAPASAWWITEEPESETRPGQMERGEFLSRLETSVRITAEELLSRVGRSTRDCPYIEHWFQYYQLKDAAHIERAIRHYAPEAHRDATAEDVISLITDRARRAVVLWLKTGKLTGVPDELPGGLAAAGIRDAASFGDPLAIRASLGAGSPLDGSVRSRMEVAFGSSFSRVRVHTGTEVAVISPKYHARAFTIGEHIAFAPGQYSPGTPIGDALIAHELAHVVQQQHAVSSGDSKVDSANHEDWLEEDADRSAVGVVSKLWNGAKETARDIRHNIKPRLRSGLRLSLSDCEPKTPAQEAKKAQSKDQSQSQAPQPPPTVSIAEVNAPNTPSAIKRIPPRVGTGVAVTVTGAASPPLTLAIAGSGSGAGSAKINGNATHTISKTETVQLSGVDQTEPGHAGNLKLVANQGSNNLAESNGFSVAAYPVKIGFTYKGPVQAEPRPGDRFLRWGAAYQKTFASDSGTSPDALNDCGLTKISENVIVAEETGYFAGGPVGQSSFEATTTAQTDRHVERGPSAVEVRRRLEHFERREGLNKSKYEAHQFFRFSCERTGLAENRERGPKVPTSGFKILKTASKSGGKYFFRVSKQGFANNDVAAGTVDDSTVKDVEV